MNTTNNTNTMNVNNMNTTELIETYVSVYYARNNEEKAILRSACREELEKRFKEEFSINERGDFDNMTEDDVRQTEAYKYAYADIDDMDWSYSDWSTNYCILGDYFDERDIVYDVADCTMIPKEVVWIAFEDFKKNNPYCIELAEKYADNGFQPIEDEEDYD